MRRHWSYLKYVLRHKWFVWQASRKIGASPWLAVIHDASKFRRSEWTPYACTFYKPDGSNQYDETPAFNLAWLLHQHRNPHHWQHWILRMDNLSPVYLIQDDGDWEGHTRIHHAPSGVDAAIPNSDLHSNNPVSDHMVREMLRHANANAGLVAIEMPRRYALEMVSDWMGAGRAITGRWECAEWYAKNREKIILHANTRALVDGILSVKDPA